MLWRARSDGICASPLGVATGSASVSALQRLLIWVLPSHGCGLPVCLRALLVPLVHRNLSTEPSIAWCPSGTDACALCALICHLILKAQGSRSADNSSVVLCGLEVMDVLGQPFSPWTAALARCKEHVDLKMRWKKSKIPISVSSPSGSSAISQEKTSEVIAS